MRYEQKRQARAKKTGTKIVQETRLWDADKKKTQKMRTKEGAHDYRYFPEPDIPPFSPDPQFKRAVADAMVELPAVRKERMKREYPLQKEMVDFLTAEKDRADFFEHTVSSGADSVVSAKWMKGELTKLLSREVLAISTTCITPQRFSDLMKLLADGTIHAKIAKKILEILLEEDSDPAVIIAEHEFMAPTADESGLERMIKEIMAGEPDAVADIKEGKPKAIGFLMGKVMKETKGSSDPATVRALLLKSLGM